MRIGLGIPPVGLPIEFCTTLVRQAEERGFESIWIGEAWGTETCTLVAALLARSRRIVMGTGILSLYLRPPTLTAMQAATLQLIAPGRVRLGLGVSTRNINTFHGLPWDHPVSRTREYVALLRRLLGGERVTHTGRFYQPHGFQLAIPLSAPLPLYLAAVNPRMLRLAGEIADGVLLAWLPVSQIPRSIAEIARGAEVAGRSLSSLDIGCYIHTVVTQDRERTFNLLRRVLVGYCQANTYIQGFRRFGYGDIVDEVHDRWQAGDRAGAEAAIPARMVEELYVFGTVEECRAHIARFVQAGVQLPIVAVPPSSRMREADFVALLGAFSQ
ncbi:MAG: LLM class flavin-dependent oxidoreductase [Candidatus Binatia bacterium]|nr:LLM class flavin-dependent oxidoreductase [Candidatus Binatia bacterium]